jgi:hypothetical protein
MTDDVRMLINDEARMTNDEGMTKSEARKPGGANGSTRNKAFPSYDCSHGARAEAASTRLVDGSQGTAFDLLKNLERPKE